MIREFAKVRLKSGEIAHVVEILESGVAYIAEIVRQSGDFSVTIDDIRHEDIASVFVETETPLVH
ncbi:MAG: hypothetical protein FWB71_02020 [Defluviitaleaceae bacterium]|nr:hypothetical protein [Defluviitaleaceae bacterium]